MNLPREKVIETLAAVLRQILIFRGQSAGPEVSIVGTTDPIKVLGLESDDLVLVATEISDMLGVDIPEDAIQWVDDSGERRRCRSVGEIADDIVNFIARAETAAHG